jgi:hypothetical protein
MGRGFGGGGAGRTGGAAFGGGGSAGYGGGGRPRKQSSPQWSARTMVSRASLFVMLQDIVGPSPLPALTLEFMPSRRIHAVRRRTV